MKSRFLLTAVIAVISAATCLGGITITLDEFGNGWLLDPGYGNDRLRWCALDDPGPGGLKLVLFYSLYFISGSLQDGDVLIYEPDSNELSDVLRFNPNVTAEFDGVTYTGGVFVYSDKADGNDHSLADYGFPTKYNATQFPVHEFGTEGYNGVTYTPKDGQPGFSRNVPTTYQFMSDTPEPSSMSLFAIGIVGVLFGLRRRHALRPVDFVV